MGLLSRFKRSKPDIPISNRTKSEPTSQDEMKEHVSPEEREYMTESPQNAPPVIDAALEKRVVRKLDRHVVPLVLVLYMLSFLDRSNIGNARIAGRPSMAQELNLNVDGRYDWLLTIFYIAYIIFEFTVILWKVFPPHYMAAFVTLSWGILAACQSAVQNWQSEMAIRFLMGGFEAGFGPGIPYLLSFFYLRHELGFRCGMFLSAAPLATTFAGALAYGITRGHPALNSWRLLFLVEGLPTIAMAPVAFFFLPDSPAQARFLTEEEKEVAVARGVRQVGSANRIGGVDWKDIGRTLLDAKAWFTALMYFSCNVSFASLPVFLPTILLEMGFTAINAQGLSAPPYFLSFLLTCGTAWIADRTQQRAYTIMILSTVAGIGYIILATSNSVGAKYFAVYLAAGGVFPTIGNILPWVMNNQGSDTRRGTGIIMLNVIGQCGPLLGTRLYPTTQAPRFVTGMSVCAAFMFFTVFLAFTLRTLLVWENKKLDEKYGKRNDGEVIGGTATGSAVAAENYGPNYRYIL